MPETPPRLAVAQWAALERIRARTAAIAAAQWQAGAELPLDTIVATVLAGQRAIVAQTDGGLSLAAGVATGTEVTPLGIEADRIIGAHARNGTSLETVYSRTAKVAREAGFQRGLDHLRTNIYMDMQLAQRDAASIHAQADERVRSWRRQINPVSGGKTCGFCIAASTRTYHRGDLLPLHPYCRCTVVESYSFDTRGLDTPSLASLYSKAGGTSRQALGRVRIDGDTILPPGIKADEIAALETRIVMDPELGPVLTGARHDSSFVLA